MEGKFGPRESGLRRFVNTIFKAAGTDDDRLIVSSIQFLAVGHGWECWRIFPHERDRLVAILDEYSLDNVLFLTGDRHRGGLYQLTTPAGNTIHEITSSPLNATTFPRKKTAPSAWVPLTRTAISVLLLLIRPRIPCWWN
jgi:hypothetical protein